MVLKMRLYAFMSLVAGILGLGATVWTLIKLGTQSSTLFTAANIFLSACYVGGITVGVLDARSEESPRIASLVKFLTPASGIAGFAVWNITAMLGRVPAYHVIPVLTLLTALVTRPRSTYDPLL